MNGQLPCYVSWKPDPGASYTDAFTIPWTDYLFYAFAPFSIILRCVQKIELEKAKGMLVVPNWPTQPWYTKLMQMIRLPTTIASTKGHLDPPQPERLLPSTVAATSSDGMQAIRTIIQKQGISTEAADIILKSWRPGTSKQYQPYIRKWIQYCHQRSIDPSNFTVGQALEFLLELFKKGLGYSSLNTARCALSCIITPNNMGSFGSQPLVVRFLKGVYESRPSVLDM